MQTILLVDDEDHIRTLFRRLLQKYDVLEAADGEEALRLARLHDLDLVITDIHLHDMDGYELRDSLKSLYPELPTVGISGSLESGGASTLTFDAFLQKPIAMADLIKVVERLTSSS